MSRLGVRILLFRNLREDKGYLLNFKGGSGGCYPLIPSSSTKVRFLPLTVCLFDTIERPGRIMTSHVPGRRGWDKPILKK